MLGLTATTGARAGLSELRDNNPDLFAIVAAWLVEVRRGNADAIRRSTAFGLPDGGTARIRTFYDFAARSDLLVVWMVEEQGDSGPVVKVVAVEHAP